MRIKLLVFLPFLGLACAQAPKPTPSHEMGAKPVLLTPGDVKWMPAPAQTGIPSAVQMAVLSGDPFKPGLFAVRLKIPKWRSGRGALAPN